MQKSESLTYEVSSQPLHIFANVCIFDLAFVEQAYGNLASALHEMGHAME